MLCILSGAKSGLNLAAAAHISHVSKTFGTQNALQDVSFSVEQGEFFALLGPNGAGKSTLINCMAGLSQPSAGNISIVGHDVQTDYREARKNIGVVPQEIVFDPFFTVSEVLSLQAGYFGLGKDNQAWQQRLLEELDLADKANATLRQLSGGMKRRLLVAQALVHKPQLVVLDEPTAGVDVDLRRSLWRFVKELHAAGHAIMLTTHYLEEAEALCDRIAILRQGELMALETKTELMKHCTTRQATLSLDRIDASLLTALQDHVVTHDSEGDSHTLCLTVDQNTDNLGALIEVVRNHGSQLRDIRVEEPDLEDVFLALTKNEA